MNKTRQKDALPNLVNLAHPVKMSSPGFTLIELMVVVLIIGLISAVSIPKLIPLIAFSALEGNARRLTNYGRAVTAQASFTSEPHVVRFDLDADPQSYYTIHWVMPKEEEEAAKAAEEQAEALATGQLPDPAAMEDLLSGPTEEGEEDPFELLAMVFPQKARKAEAYSNEEIDLYLNNRAIDPEILEPEDFDEVRVQMAIDEEFDGFHRSRLEARAANVRPPEELTDEAGPIFGPGDEFDLDEEEPIEKEVADPILRRHKMPSEVMIHSVTIEGERHSSGVVEVEFGPLGMKQYVEIELVSGDDEWCTIIWDPSIEGAKWKFGTAD